MPISGLQTQADMSLQRQACMHIIKYKHESSENDSVLNIPWDIQSTEI